MRQQEEAPRHVRDTIRGGKHGIVLCKTAIFTNISCHSWGDRKCHRNNNLNIYELRQVFKRQTLVVQINSLSPSDPLDCKWLREYAYFATTPPNDINKNCSRRESHGSLQIGERRWSFTRNWCLPATFRHERLYLRIKFPWQIHSDKKLFKLTSNLIYVERWYIFTTLLFPFALHNFLCVHQMPWRL